MSINLALKTGLLSVSVWWILTCMACFCAEAKDHYVVRQVTTKSEGSTSTIIIGLNGRPAYRVIPIGQKEMVIAFRDTALSRDVCPKETIIGDEWIRYIEAEQKPFGVTTLLVKLHKPRGDIRYQIVDDKDVLRIEIGAKAQESKKKDQHNTPEPHLSGAALEGGHGVTALQEGPRSEEKTWIDDLLKVESKVATPDSDLFREAVRYYRVGRWNNVIPPLRKIIESYEESRHLEQAYFLLAESLSRMFEKHMSGHSVEIMKYFREASSRFPRSDYVPHALVSIGRCYLELDNYYEALAHYNVVLKNYKTHPAAAEALFERGRFFVITNKLQKAIKDFEEFEKRYPKTRLAMTAKIERAKALFHTKSFKRSLGVLKDIITKEPVEIYRNHEVLLFMGYNYYELGQMRQARDVLSKRLNYYPERESNHLVLTKIADTYREEGIKGKASKLYDLVINTYPDTEGSVISLFRFAADGEKAGPNSAPFQIQNGKIATGNTAREIYKQIIEKNPDNTLSQLAMLKLALLFQKDKDYEQSLVALEEILTKHPDTPLEKEVKAALRASLQAIVEQEKQAGSAEKIIGVYERVRSSLSFEDIPDLLMLVGDAYKQLGLFEEALSVYEEAKKSYTADGLPANLLFDLVESSYRTKRFDEAERALRAFVARYPENKETSKAHYWIGNILLERKEYDKAVRSLDLALHEGPDQYLQAKILVAMADVSKSQGDHEKTVGSLRKAITLLNQDKSTTPDDLQLAYEALGDTYFKLRQTDKALSAFEKALKFSPQDSDKHGLQFKLAQCYQSQKATGKAKDMLNQIAASGDPLWSKLAQAQMKEISIKESVQ
jgi:TolA-binding protein